MIKRFWRLWAERRHTVLGVSNVAMLVLALTWLPYQYWRLLSQADPIWPSSPEGAIDLLMRRNEVRAWFSGVPVYEVSAAAIYPPASYALLWPLVGWTTETSVRWAYAVSVTVSLAAVTWLLVRESRVNSRAGRAFVAAVSLANYAAGATIGNGQLSVYLVLVIVVGVLAQRRQAVSWLTPLVASVCMLLALVKPTFSIPFGWVLLVGHNGFASLMAAGAAYVGLTLWAASYQEASPVVLIGQWLSSGSSTARVMGTMDLHVGLGTLGFGGWILPASAVVLLVLGIWVIRNRQADAWMLVGVAALITRFWSYHLWYDDTLLLLPTIALIRTRRSRQSRTTRVLADLLVALMALSLLAPGGLYLLPAPWNGVYVASQTAVWLATLGFLLAQARWARSAPAAGVYRE